MSLGVLDQVNRFPKALRSHGTCDVQVNALSVDKIFGLYQRAGFLYPEKAARLRPHWVRIRENWQRMLLGGESLLSVLSAGDDAHGHASIAVWRTTLNGWVLQHLVNESNPLAARAVMLAWGADSILKGLDASGQNWFRPENRFPARVFGSLVQAVGETSSSVQRLSYFALPRRLSLSPAERITIVPYDSSHKQALCALSAAERGTVYVTGEDLSGDVNCEAIDELYQRVGLRRRRHVWLAYAKLSDEPIGAVIAYRGPLGINFSYLENRCDLLVSKALPPAGVTDVVSSLLHACSGAYQDFELDEIPVMAGETAAYALMKVGAQFVRHYCQGLWLKNGFTRFYEHIDSFYSKLLSRVEKHSRQTEVAGAR